GVWVGGGRWRGWALRRVSGRAARTWVALRARRAEQYADPRPGGVAGPGPAPAAVAAGRRLGTGAAPAAVAEGPPRRGYQRTESGVGGRSVGADQRRRRRRRSARTAGRHSHHGSGAADVVHAVEHIGRCAVG